MTPTADEYEALAASQARLAREAEDAGETSMAAYWRGLMRLYAAKARLLRDGIGLREVGERVAFLAMAGFLFVMVWP